MFRAHLCLSKEGGYNHLVLDGHLQQNTTCMQQPVTTRRPLALMSKYFITAQCSRPKGHHLA